VTLLTFSDSSVTLLSSRQPPISSLSSRQPPISSLSSRQPPISSATTKAFSAATKAEGPYPFGTDVPVGPAPCARGLFVAGRTDRAGPEANRMRTSTSLTEAVEHAVRAPSVHNTQPWRWRIGRNTVDLYADPARHLPATDPDRRDLILSCGAALHHFAVALAAAGRSVQVVRMPDPEDRWLLATVRVDVGSPNALAAGLFPAIDRRRTDRRRMSHRPVPATAVRRLQDVARSTGAVLVSVTGPAMRKRLTLALEEAARRQAATPGYGAELEIWTRRHPGARDGVSATAVAAPPTGLTEPTGLRRFPRAELRQPLPPAGHGRPDDAAEFLLLTTPTDREIDRLRAGEAASAVLLTATGIGLATTPLSQGTEVAASRDLLRRTLGVPENPQLLLRIGWPASCASELAATPRRDLRSVLLPT
jgi:nitroreductase family protein